MPKYLDANDIFTSVIFERKLLTVLVAVRSFGHSLKAVQLKVSALVPTLLIREQDFNNLIDTD